MEFAHEVRAELARAWPNRRCCRRAELAAFVRYLGRRTPAGFEVASAHPAVARKVFLLAKHVDGVRLKSAAPGAGRHRYRVRFALSEGAFGGPPTRDCCGRAYLRGAWLSRGSVSEPDAGYHLEFAPTEDDGAAEIRGLLRRYGIGAGVARRKGAPVVYVKEADGIAEFLRVAGAHGALLTWEDYRVLKHMRNRVNRLVNAETANVKKVVGAALKQLEDIRLIEERWGLERLPPSLAEAARLRLQHEDLSLADLGRRSDPPLSKSAVNHRMRRLAEIAAKLRRSSRAPG